MQIVTLDGELGFRPVVCLQKGVRLQKIRNGNYNAYYEETAIQIKNATINWNDSTTNSTAGTVTATASTTSGFTIQTSTDGEHWENTPSQTLSRNGYVYARLTDGNYTGNYVAHQITSINK